MLITEKRKSQIVAYFFTLMLVFILLGRYGSEAIEWILTKLYELFIMKKTLQ